MAKPKASDFYDATKNIARGALDPSALAEINMRLTEFGPQVSRNISKALRGALDPSQVLGLYEEALIVAAREGEAAGATHFANALGLPRTHGKSFRALAETLMSGAAPVEFAVPEQIEQFFEKGYQDLETLASSGAAAKRREKIAKEVGQTITPKTSTAKGNVRAKLADALTGARRSGSKVTEEGRQVVRQASQVLRQYPEAITAKEVMDGIRSQGGLVEAPEVARLRATLTGTPAAQDPTIRNILSSPTPPLDPASQFSDVRRPVEVQGRYAPRRGTIYREMSPYPAAPPSVPEEIRSVLLGPGPAHKTQKLSPLSKNRFQGKQNSWEFLVEKKGNDWVASAEGQEIFRGSSRKRAESGARRFLTNRSSGTLTPDRNFAIERYVPPGANPEAGTSIIRRGLGGELASAEGLAVPKFVQSRSLGGGAAESLASGAAPEVAAVASTVAKTGGKGLLRRFLRNPITQTVALGLGGDLIFEGALGAYDALKTWADEPRREAIQAARPSVREMLSSMLMQRRVQEAEASRYAANPRLAQYDQLQAQIQAGRVPGMVEF